MKLAFSVVMEEIKKEEGFRAKVYKCTAGKNTIGFGRNLDDNGITYEEAEYLLKNDIKMVDTWLNDNVPIYANLTPERQFVLIDMCFNLGFVGVLKFRKMFEAIKAGEFAKAAAEMLNSKWAAQVGPRARKLARIMETGEMGEYGYGKNANHNEQCGPSFK